MQRDSSLETFIGDSVYILDIYFSFADALPIKVRVNRQEIDENPFQDARVREAFDLAHQPRRAGARGARRPSASPPTS